MEFLAFIMQRVIKPKAELSFLNQARAGHRPTRTWFLIIDPVQIVGIRVCVCLFVSLLPRLLITSGMIWTSYDWLYKFYRCYMATAVIVNGCGLGIDTHCGN